MDEALVVAQDATVEEFELDDNGFEEPADDDLEAGSIETDDFGKPIDEDDDGQLDMGF